MSRAHPVVLETCDATYSQRVRKLLLGAVVTGMTVWGMGALYYSPLPTFLRQLLALTFGLATVGAFLSLPHRRWTLLGFVLVWGILVLWWSTIPASNTRAWQPDVAVLPSATLDGDRVTLHNIRHFAYRTETDFTPRYYDKTVDLRQLESVDLISVYWAGEAIAHLMVSFGFSEQDYVAISIETRKERTEDYSSIKGFFKQYELIYVVADERDVIRLRTTYRQPPEEVYLYRTRIPPARARRLFLDYVREINHLVAAAGLLQYPDHQLYHQHLVPCPGGGWHRPVQLENSLERVCPGLRIRERRA